MAQRSRLRHGTARHVLLFRAVPRVSRAVPIRVPCPPFDILVTARHAKDPGTARKHASHDTAHESRVIRTVRS